jgi:hypothetical protein
MKSLKKNAVIPAIHAKIAGIIAITEIPAKSLPKIFFIKS